MEVLVVISFLISWSVLYSSDATVSRFYDRVPVLAWLTKHRSDYELAEMSRFLKKAFTNFKKLFVMFKVFSS